MRTLKGKTLELLYDTPQSDLLACLTTIRGISADTFGAEVVHDPLLMPDIEVAVERILLARERGERVMIFGDYDVDGISSTAALFLFLRDELGMQVSYRLPHRVKDGYGIKNYHIEEIAQTGAKLIITVDCGTKDIEQIVYASSLGLDVIVTDHHACTGPLPQCVAVVNPKRPDSLYPFTGLSGSGVVWKLLHAILAITLPLGVRFTHSSPKGRGDVNNFPRGNGMVPFLLPLGEGQDEGFDILRKYVDIVSLGTVADCMPMIDENRTIVRRGILQSQNSHHPFFQTFVDTLNRPILTEEDIGFFVGPLLNAGGRLTTPYQSLSTILASSLDSYAKIQELISVNELRKSKSRDAYIRALEQIDTSAPFLVMVDPLLEHGILGIVAARLTEQFLKPSAVFTQHNGNFVGSLRAPAGYDLVKILDSIGESFLHFGGHAGAAGCTVDAAIITEIPSLFSQAFTQLYGTDAIVPTIRVDTVLDMSDITLDTLEIIESLRPFGQGFPSPVFMLSDIQISPQSLGQSGEHLRWETSGAADIVGFHMAQFRDALNSGPVNLIGTLKSHTWRDVTRPQFQVLDAVIHC